MKFTRQDLENGAWISAAGATYGPYSNAAAGELARRVEKDLFPFNHGADAMPSLEVVDQAVGVTRDSMFQDDSAVQEPADIKPR